MPLIEPKKYPTSYQNVVADITLWEWAVIIGVSLLLGFGYYLLLNWLIGV